MLQIWCRQALLLARHEASADVATGRKLRRHHDFRIDRSTAGVRAALLARCALERRTELMTNSVGLPSKQRTVGTDVRQEPYMHRRAAIVQPGPVRTAPYDTLYPAFSIRAAGPGLRHVLPGLLAPRRSPHPGLQHAAECIASNNPSY